MAKSSRASSRKANNQRLKANVFGPVEAARQERLAAKLLAIASQPKPVPERKMEDVPEEDDAEQQKPEGEQKADDTAMDIDPTTKSTKSKKGRIVKKRARKSSIVFPKFPKGGDRKTIRKKK